MSGIELEQLVPAVLSAVRHARGFATKTKLLKYLYLIDIEHFRRFRETATGFQWIFHKYGPWTNEYDPVLEDLRQTGIIQITTGTRDDLDTKFVDAERVPASLDALGWPFDLQVTVRRIIETWADRPTGEILDYVYFHTEPMQGAERGQKLDFTKVEQGDRTEFYSRTPSFKNEEELSKARKELRKLFKQLKPQPTVQKKATPPK
ncbi:Panacea domain-containing protein, partial [Acidobacteriia bacterium AH_259_A11_L15]|nr:Panacea domain-containing protein [Acidobacteriia bacterium AH_259_A11_L15]